MIGIANQAELPNWNLTDARLEQQLALFNDSLFPIDDFATLGGKPRETYQRLQNLAYKLHQGWGRGRHSSFIGNTAREQWRVIGITSSEMSIREFAEAAGRQRQGGECVRLIDVPILMNGKSNLFDRTKLPLNRAASADILGQLTEAVSQNYGAVFRRHVRNIIEQRSGLKARLQKDVHRFADFVRRKHDGTLSRDVAETFGVAYAAGAFAIQSNLLPWRERDLLDAIGKVFNAAKALLPDEGVALRSGIQSLQILLNDIRRTARLGVNQIDFEKARGICKPKKSYHKYLVKNEAFVAIFATPRQKALVLKWLAKKGRITLSGPHQAPKENRKAREQFEWPDGTRRRSYEIRWPRKAVGRRKDKNKARRHRTV